MRIVSLLPGATDMLVALGGADLLVGVSHACSSTQGAAALPRVTTCSIAADGASGAIDATVREIAAAGQPMYALDERLIRSLGPDLIVTQALCDVCAVSESDVRALAARLSPAPAVVALGGSTIDGVFADLAALATATGLGSESDELTAGLRRRMRTVHDRLNAAEAPRPRVAVIEWTDPIFAGGHWVPEQVKRAGGVDVLATPGGHSVVASADQVRAANPEIVIVAPCGWGVERAATEAMQLIDAHPWLAAVDVWAIDAHSLTSRPGPRIVDGIETMARIFAPTLFPAPNPALARRVTRPA